jgi:hypothetical protein
MRKYGEDSFLWEIVLTLEDKQKGLLSCMEKFFIREFHTYIKDPKYNGGYNETEGGEGIRRAMPESQKKSISQSSRGKPRIAESQIRCDTLSLLHVIKARSRISGEVVFFKTRKEAMSFFAVDPSAFKYRIDGTPHYTNRRTKEIPHDWELGYASLREKCTLFGVAFDGRPDNNSSFYGWENETILSKKDMTDDKKQIIYTSEVRKRMSESHKGQAPGNKGKHYKIRDTSNYKGGQNKGVPRTDAQKEVDRVVKLTKYLERAQPCIKCTNREANNIQYFVSTNEVAVRLVKLTGAMTTVQHILDDPLWVSSKPNSKSWQVLKDWKIEYCPQAELLDARPELK